MQHGDEKSFEYMRRDDAQYELGVVVAHNEDAKVKRGSCIFLHVQKEQNASTAGCTSMRLDDLKTIVELLDKDKNPLLIQVPNSSAQEIIKLYPQLKSSTLLLP
jgi:L,D-peptidoglycan transpeptidase YkuD (ErfK/YbiS/YcfS/YnhG family)